MYYDVHQGIIQWLMTHGKTHIHSYSISKLVAGEFSVYILTNMIWMINPDEICLAPIDMIPIKHKH